MKLIMYFHSVASVHANDINILYYEKIPKIGEKSPYYRLDVLSKFCHFCNVLKMPNNSYQLTRHLELNRMVQAILS